MPTKSEVVVGLATVESLTESLLTPNPEFLLLWQNKDLNVTDNKHPLGQTSGYVTRKQPAVIFDDGADNCSPVITFDSQGSALHMHLNITSELAFAEIMAQSGIPFPSATQDYFAQTVRYLSDPSVTACIGGTNLYESDVLRAGRKNKADEIIDYTKARLNKFHPAANLMSLISRRFDNQQVSSSVAPDNTVMRGFVFIPRYLARNDRNHLLAITAGEQADLRAAFRLPKP